MAKEKEQKIETDIAKIIEQLDKDYGAGSVIYGDKVEQFDNIISTGSFGLDIALGIGGLPLAGKVVELFGWESSGKSTLTQTFIGNVQKRLKEVGSDKKCLLLDGENSLDGEYATKLGVDLNDLIVVQLDQTAGEGAYNKMEMLVKSGKIAVVVVDSYNSLQPLKVLVGGEIGDSSMGVHARMLGQVVARANYLAAQYGTLFIFIGQIRQSIGVMYGSPDVTQGGNALKFYSHVRMNIRKSVRKDDSTKEEMANITTVKVIKNKMAPPFKTASFEVLFGEGIDVLGEVVDAASELNIINKSGSWYSYEGSKLGQGANAVREIL